MARKQATASKLDELTKVKVEGGDIRVTIADVTTAVAVGSCEEATGIGGLTFQPVVVERTDTPIVQHVAEGTIVVSIAGQGGGDEQIVRHDVLLRCVEVVLAS